MVGVSVSCKWLYRLLKNAGCNDNESIKLFDECVWNCGCCGEYEKPSLKLVIGFSVAENSIKLVCMDLKRFK